MKTTNALDMLDELIGGDQDLQDMIADESGKIDVAALIYSARTAAGLTQKELADRARTTQPVIARMENADYDGHSLSMLRRIANALDLAVDIKLVPRFMKSYRPKYLEDAAEANIRPVTRHTCINAAAYSSATWPGNPWRDHGSAQVG